ncbi:protein of unknown function (DUF1840) [Burkholderiales bacterium JOSHI_001]|nr:protein of unknown function (DUF1840) [Burkholderiales bacterium JOSHI_001]
MLYKFKSKAGGDVIMLGPNGDQLLKLIGKDTTASGIVEVAQMPAALAALEAAVAQDEAARAERGAADDIDDTAGAKGISLRQRVWPMVELMRRAQAADQVIVWGV